MGSIGARADPSTLGAILGLAKLTPALFSVRYVGICNIFVQPENLHEMNGPWQNRKLLWAVLRITTSPVPRPTTLSQSHRAFTTTIPRQAPSGFSVSFAPETVDLPNESPAVKNSPVKGPRARKTAVKRAVPSPKANAHALQKRPTEDAGQTAPSPQEHAAGIAISEGQDTTIAHDEIVQPEVEGESVKPDGFTEEVSAPEVHRRDAFASLQEVTKPKKKNRPKDRGAKAKLKRLMDAESQVGSEPGQEDSQCAPSLAPPKPKVEPLLKKESRKDLRKLETAVSPELKVGESSKANTKPALRTLPLKKREPWQTQKQALLQKFGETGWSPRKKLSPDTIEGIRALHEQYPDKYPTPVLSEQFKVSPEAIRRILKSKWRPSEDKVAERRERWAKRHDRIWDQQAEIGLRPARTKSRKAPEPGEVDQEMETEELHNMNARQQARSMEM